MTSQIPAGYELTRTTPVFDNKSVPGGLLNAHRVADGVWGRLVVYSGELTFVFEDRPDGPIPVSAGGHVDIPPAQLHHLELAGAVDFAVEFYRPKQSAEKPDLESTGMADPGPHTNERNLHE